MTDTVRAARIRLAVVSTPRSGNTWLRELLAAVTDSENKASHTPDGVLWDELPERVVLQIHWLPTEEFRRRLDEAGFKVVTIVRHPLDLLMSILHFCRHEAETGRWLDGAGGDEQSLVGAAPWDPAVLDYAAGSRFRHLLSVSDAWWPLADATVRYEDLVADPVARFRALVDELGMEVDPDAVPAAVESRRLEVVRPTSSNHHYWQGTPGGWRRLLTAEVAHRLAEPVADQLSARGYELDPLPDLDDRQAALNWAAVEAR